MKEQNGNNETIWQHLMSHYQEIKQSKDFFQLPQNKTPSQTSRPTWQFSDSEQSEKAWLRVSQFRILLVAFFGVRVRIAQKSGANVKIRARYFPANRTNSSARMAGCMQWGQCSILRSCTYCTGGGQQISSPFSRDVLPPPSAVSNDRTSIMEQISRIWGLSNSTQHPVKRLRSVGTAWYK